MGREEWAMVEGKVGWADGSGAALAVLELWKSIGVASTPLGSGRRALVPGVSLDARSTARLIAVTPNGV